MMNYRFQKAILVSRKILSVLVTISAPFLLKLAIDYATIKRGYSGSLGGEVLLPILVIFLGYIIYPRYEISPIEDKKEEITLLITDEIGKVHRIKLTKRS